MNIELQTAFIATITTIITFGLSKIIEIWLARKSHQQSQKEIYSTYVEFSLQRKIETYHELLRIIRNVGYGSSYDTGTEIKYSDAEKIQIIQNALKNLLTWEYESGGIFFLSAESFERFRRLKTRLMAKPAYTDEAYSIQQLQNITGAVSGLRSSLFKDLYIYRLAEDSFANRQTITELMEQERSEVLGKPFYRPHNRIQRILTRLKDFGKI